MYTVADLIAELSKLDPALPVCGDDCDGFPSLDPIDVSLETYGINNDQPVVVIS